MKFSILVAHYNNFEYFKDCYKSIIEQSVQDFEVIIVDDCSTDGSFEKVKVWVQNDSRFKVFQNEENKGVGYTKKKCIEMATGDICGFLDPDDALVENALKVSLNEYQKNENIVATYSKFYLCDEKLNIQKVFPNTKKIPNGDIYFLNINLEVAHFFTFRKSIYLQTERVLEEYKVAEDQDLYLKLYEKGNFVFINKPLLRYRIHNKGLSHDKEKTKERNESWHKVLQNTLERRNITEIYGRKVSGIENLPKFVFEKENTFLKRLIRKFL
ncbi:MAG: glycosyltransferase [Flavobacteriaceae bacterium]|nr:glycosyltransferase [Flavobacteriaceae bacterium]